MKLLGWKNNNLHLCGNIKIIKLLEHILVKSAFVLGNENFNVCYKVCLVNICLIK